jgi:alpha-1,2-mannosyltransferase
MTLGLQRLLDLLRTGDWLNGNRILIWSGTLLIFEILAFIFFIAGTHGYIVKLDKPVTTDFVSFYAAGILANSDHASLVYNAPDHYVAEQAATQPGIDYVYFLYPPIFLLLCSVLARLPYLLAFLVFETTSCLLYLIVMRQILNDQGWKWLVPTMAYPAVFWAVGTGQNSFLTAAFFGIATLCLDERPIIAGMGFGLLCYKPHFGLLIPIALVGGQHWKAVVSTAASMVALVVLSAAVYGWDTWRAFFVTFVSGRDIFTEGLIPFAGLVSIFATARIAGLSVGAPT